MNDRTSRGAGHDQNFVSQARQLEDLRNNKGLIGPLREASRNIYDPHDFTRTSMPSKVETGGGEADNAVLYSPA